MSTKELNFTWGAVNNRVAKIGVGAYLSASDTTDVTTSYIKLEGTFVNVEFEGFEIDGATSKLKYNPADGIDRTFKLAYSGEGHCPTKNDEFTVGIEVTNDGTPAIVTGTESVVKCRTAGSPYGFSRVFPLSLEVGDLIQIQVKGDASFTLTMDEFTTTLTKFY